MMLRTWPGAIARVVTGYVAMFVLAVTAMGAPALAQVKTDLPAVVVGAKPAVIERIKVHSPSVAGNLEGNSADRDVIVVLPPGYRADPGKRYPVVYALHGYFIGAEQWIQEIHVPQVAEGAFANGVPEMIVVLPDSKTLHLGSVYSSSATVGNFEDFVATDLVAYIDGHYRTIPRRESRGLVGHSMGGYGATRIGMKHSDVFGALYIMSPGGLEARPIQLPEKADIAALQELSTPEEVAAVEFPARGLLAMSSAWSPNPNKPPLFCRPAVRQGRQAGRGGAEALECEFAAGDARPICTGHAPLCRDRDGHRQRGQDRRSREAACTAARIRNPEHPRNLPGYPHQPGRIPLPGLRAAFFGQHLSFEAPPRRHLPKCRRQGQRTLPGDHGGRSLACPPCDLPAREPVFARRQEDADLRLGERRLQRRRGQRAQPFAGDRFARLPGACAGFHRRGAGAGPGGAACLGTGPSADGPDHDQGLARWSRLGAGAEHAGWRQVPRVARYRRGRRFRIQLRRRAGNRTRYIRFTGEGLDRPEQRTLPGRGGPHPGNGSWQGGTRKAAHARALHPGRPDRHCVGQWPRRLHADRQGSGGDGRPAGRPRRYLSRSHGGAVAAIALDWLEWQLRDNADASRSFLGENCRLCTVPGWTIDRKGFRRKSRMEGDHGDRFRRECDGGLAATDRAGGRPRNHRVRIGEGVDRIDVRRG